MLLFVMGHKQPPYILVKMFLFISLKLFATPVGVITHHETLKWQNI